MGLKLRSLLYSSLLFFVVVTGTGWANTPIEQIRDTVKEVHEAVHNAPSDEQRKESLRQILTPRFDWPAMAKHAMGKHWDSLAARQSEFVAAFQDFLGNAYVGKIATLKKEKVVFVRESVEQSQAQVDTKIIPANGEAMSVSYRLRRSGEQWKIHDVIVDDISVVSNYRSQFSRILAKGTVDDLFKQLKEKDSKPRP